MPDDSCPLDPSPQRDGDRELDAMLKMNRVAVVGMSDDPSRPAHYVPAFMIDHGKDVVPVNPRYEQVLGRKCYAELTHIPQKVEMVLVFRRSQYCPEVVRQAVEAGAKGIWLQSGIISDEARQIARAAGLYYIENRCMMVELSRLGRRRA